MDTALRMLGAVVVRPLTALILLVALWVTGQAVAGEQAFHDTPTEQVAP